MAVEPLERLARGVRQLCSDLLSEIASNKADTGHVAPTGLPGARHIDRGVRACLDRRDRSARVKGHGRGDRGPKHRITRLILQRVRDCPEDRRQRGADALCDLPDDLLQADRKLAGQLR